MTAHILLAEDERSNCDNIAEFLKTEGYRVSACYDGPSALKSFDSDLPDLVLADLMMPGLSGMELMQKIQTRETELPFILMTAFGSIQTAVEAMKIGASDYIVKPLEFDDLLLRIRRALKQKQLQAENRRLREELLGQSSFQNIVGQTAVMRRLFGILQKISRHKSTVLIGGESGTGKEMVARAIHYSGINKDKPFVSINCGAIPKDLIESELFGHAKGSFTGAEQARQGLFAEADGGTILLDEIGDLPLALQVKLLRVLEERCFRPVGTNHEVTIDLRVVAATNQDLKRAVEQKTFREDLYYRLNVVNIHLPPLRERREDIPLLVQHFIEKHGKRMGKKMKGVEKSALKALMGLPLKGNVRELENMIERAIIFSEEPTLSHHDFEWQAHVSTVPDAALAEIYHSAEDLKQATDRFQKDWIEHCLNSAQGNMGQAAKQSGLSLSSLYRKCKELGIVID